MWYLYILQSKRDNGIYIGITSDLKKRFEEHNQGKVKSTRNRRPLMLVYYEAYRSKKDCRRREIELKNKGQQREFLKERIKNCLII